ncbi:hypothetical protein [Aquimarina sp. SS2-1]|uniref:hypothetical protein n=1 Tax=Aquimarina besae TaxID=3342247 RepID=UPI0036712760
MITFLLILGGLIAFNFILLKFSIQSVDTDKRNTKVNKVQSVNSDNEIGKAKTAGIPKAA